jgi:NAD(P)-dependent dehydrogenase (short-subunit alcohol dehydrogenase family)
MQQSKERRVTRDGHEEILQTNILGPFLLTQLILPTIKKDSGARIVFMSSQLHKPKSMGPSVNWRWDDPEQTTKFDPMVAYKNSKLAVNWTAFELARRLKSQSITVNAVCPGFVPETASASSTGILRWLMKHVFIYAPFARSQKLATSYLINYLTSPQWEGRTGLYLTDGKEIRASEQSYDENESRRFWEWASQIVGTAIETA